MNRYKKLALLVIPFSFLFGTWWGLSQLEDKSRYNIQPDVTIKLLSLKNFIPEEVISSFYAKTNILLKVDEVENDEDLLEKITESPATYDLIQVISYQARNLITEQRFLKLKISLKDIRDSISNDFLSLPFDPDNEFLVPVTWGINGFLFNKANVAQPPKTMKEIFEDEKLVKKIEFLSSPLELLAAIKSYGLIGEEWLKPGEMKGAKDKVKKLLSNYNLSSKDSLKKLASGEISFLQMPSGEASYQMKMNESFGYWIPDEQTTLWISLIGISKATSHQNAAKEFLQFVLRPKIAKSIVEQNHQATVNKDLVRYSIEEMQKSQFLREIPLNQVKMVTNAHAFQPIWTDVLSEIFPAHFEKSEELSKSEKNKLRN